MADSKFSVQAFDLKHYSKTEAYARAVQALFDSATKDITHMKQIGKFDPNKPFRWEDYPQAKAIMEQITLQLATRVVGTIERGSRSEWLSACKKNDEYLSHIMNTSKLSKKQLSQMQDRRLDALTAFQERKVNGLDLSQRVWQYVNQYKENLEDGIDLGLGVGTSADVLSREVRKYLQDPDMYFRRFRVKVGTDENGQTVYGRKWKRMIKTADGNVRWIDEAPKDYHPGAGKYRSSYKNAMRLTRTEINMAYRESDWQRWQQLEFVVGFDIHRSNHRPEYKCKLCERLKGRYPKTFKFVGWHPHCRCYVTPVIMDDETFNNNELEDLRAALRGTNAKHDQAKNAVVKMPDSFLEWANETAEKLSNGEMHIKHMPYFVRDNFVDGNIEQGLKPEILMTQSDAQRIVEIARKRHAARTQQQADEIQKRWNEHNKQIELTKQQAANILKVAPNWIDVDSSELKQAIASGNVKKMKDATQSVVSQIKAQQAAEKALSDIIPDVHDWHKKFTLAELQTTHGAIERTFARWTQDNNLFTSLDKIRKNLEYEIQWMETKGRKYATWEIARDAYRRKLDEIKHRLDMLDIKNDIVSQRELLLKSKSTIGKNLINEFDTLFDDDNTTIAMLRQKSDEITKRAAQIEAQRLRRLKMNNQSGSSTYKPKSDAEVKKDFEDYLRSIGASTSNKIVVDKGFVHLQGLQHEEIYRKNRNRIETQAEHDQLWNHIASKMRWARAGYIQTSNSFYINKDFRKLNLRGAIDAAAEARLRANGATDDDIRTIKLLDKKISNFSLPIPLLATRYVRLDALQSIFGSWATATTRSEMMNLIKSKIPLQGASLSSDPAYMSASTNELQNVFYSRYDVKLMIEIPPNTPMYMSNNYVESEIVLSRSTKLEFIDVSLGKTGSREHLIVRCRVV